MAKFLSKLVAGSTLAFLCSAAHAQSAHPASIAAEYTYLRANIAPGCACFSLKGGSAQALVSRRGHLAATALAHRAWRWVYHA